MMAPLTTPASTWYPPLNAAAASAESFFKRVAESPIAAFRLELRFESRTLSGADDVPPGPPVLILLPLPGRMPPAFPNPDSGVPPV